VQEECESINIPRDAGRPVRLCPSRRKEQPPPHGIPLEAGPLGIMGNMPMSRQPRTRSLSFSSPRLCVTFLFPSSLPRLGGVSA